MIDISNLKRWDCCCKDVDCMGSGPGLPTARFVKFEDVLELLKQADNTGMDAIALWREFIASTPSSAGVSDFLHRNAVRINAVVAQQHHA